MTEVLVRGQSSRAATADVGAPSVGIFTALLRALHDARRRGAERELRRHQYLLDRYATPLLRGQFVDPSTGQWMVSGLLQQRR